MQADSKAVVPGVEIRLGIGPYFVQVAAGRLRSADEYARELISAPDLSNEPVVVVDGSRRMRLAERGRSPGAAMLGDVRAEPRLDGGALRAITECPPDN
jgi:hypothetical protein